MEPILVSPKVDPLVGLKDYDAEQLFELGNQQFKEEAYDRSLKIFEKLIETFPDSSQVAAAHFNAGLSLERLEEPTKAADYFKKILSNYPKADCWPDAHFRAAHNYAKSKQWPEATDTFWAARQLPDLSAMDELEARVNTAIGWFMQNDYTTSEVEFMSALRFYNSHERKQYLPAKYFVGQSRFYLGEIYARQFESVELSPPKEDEVDWTTAMGKELEEKCRLLLRAQNNFIRAIRVGHRGWATASGNRIGSMYEHLYDVITSVPVPPELSVEAQEIYQEEVRNKVKILVVKAIQVYEATLEMAERVGEKNEWVDRTATQLERMKKLYLASVETETPAS